MLLDLARQFMRYFFVGVAALVFHYGTLIALVESDALGPDVAALAGYVVGGFVSYGLNRRFTFDSDRSHAVAGPRFAFAAAVGFGMTFVLMHVLAGRLGVHYLLAQLVTTGIVFVWTFIANRFWTFADASRP